MATPAWQPGDKFLTLSGDQSDSVLSAPAEGTLMLLGAGQAFALLKGLNICDTTGRPKNRPGTARIEIAKRRNSNYLMVMLVCLRAALFLTALSMLAACSVDPTPYQPKDAAGGYAEQRLDSRTWRVHFQGNYATARDRVENYLLLRSAEVVLAAGFERFVIAEKDVEQVTDYHTYSAQPFCDPFWYDHGPPYRYRYPYCYGPGYYPERYYTTYTRYTGYAVVRALLTGEPSPGLQTYDAREIVQQLGHTARLPGYPGS